MPTTPKPTALLSTDPRPATSARRAVLRRAAAALGAAALLVAFAACEREPAEERVARVRADYEAELNSFQVREKPVAGPIAQESAAAERAEVAADGEVTEAGPAGTEGAEAGTPEVEPLPDEAAVERDVVLDILLRNRGDETLPGITLDVEQVDARDGVKASYKIYVDASGAHPGGQPAQVAYVLEDVDFEPGDKFAVEVRPTVPPEAWGDYRELNEAAEASAP